MRTKEIGELTWKNISDKMGFDDFECYFKHRKRNASK